MKPGSPWLAATRSASSSRRSITRSQKRVIGTEAKAPRAGGLALLFSAPSGASTDERHFGCGEARLPSREGMQSGPWPVERNIEGSISRDRQSATGSVPDPCGSG